MLDATGGRGARRRPRGERHRAGAAPRSRRFGRADGSSSSASTRRPRAIDLFDLSLREIDTARRLRTSARTTYREALESLATTGLADTVIETVVRLGRFVEDGLVPFAEGLVHGKVVVDVAG